MRGSTTPRLYTPPLVSGLPGPCGCGCALTPETSLGFSAVQFWSDVLGFDPLPWQRWLLIHALELLPDQRFRFRTVLVMVARQNGKTSLVEVKNLWKMFVLQVPLVIGTAQNLDMAEESWDKAIELVESTPELATELSAVDKTNGKKALKLTNGSRWKIAAASRRGGRGLSGDDVNLDELREHLDWQAWGAVTKTTMARSNAQIWAYSNAGDARSIVLNSLQDAGKAALKQPGVASSQAGLFEWSAPDDVTCTCRRKNGAPHASSCRLRDRNAWAQANPALGYTITVEALESALDTDPETIFRTECLCQRVPDLGGRAIDQAQWILLADANSRRQGDVAVAVDITPNRDYASIGLYGHRADGVEHMQLLDYRPGVDWIIERLIELKTVLDPIAIGLGRGTFASLQTELAQHGLTVPDDADRPARGDLLVLGSVEMSAATGHILDAIRQTDTRHCDQAELNAAVQGAKTREIGDTIAWSRKTAEADISPLVAVTFARYALTTRGPLLVDASYDVLESVA